MAQKLSISLMSLAKEALPPVVSQLNSDSRDWRVSFSGWLWVVNFRLVCSSLVADQESCQALRVRRRVAGDVRAVGVSAGRRVDRKEIVGQAVTRKVIPALRHFVRSTAVSDHVAEPGCAVDDIVRLGGRADVDDVELGETVVTQRDGVPATVLVWSLRVLMILSYQTAESLGMMASAHRSQN